MLTFSDNELRNAIKNAMRPEDSIYKDDDALLLNVLRKPQSF